MMHHTTTPIITIDGPSASGKGTIAKSLAHRLGFHYLDSGSLYRIVAWAAKEAGIPADSNQELLPLIISLEIMYEGDTIWVNGQQVQSQIREEKIGLEASYIAQNLGVRAQLLDFQRDFVKPPGLVSDGRDMGSVVFPNAQLKVFLTADVEERARRRYNQLILQGKSANLADIRKNLEQRDKQDQQRLHAPLLAASDARLLDGTHLPIGALVELICKWWLETAV
jgi:cytidylate kinase